MMRHLGLCVGLMVLRLCANWGAQLTWFVSLVDRRPLWRDSFSPSPPAELFWRRVYVGELFPLPGELFRRGVYGETAIFPPPRTGVDVGLGSAG